MHNIFSSSHFHTFSSSHASNTASILCLLHVTMVNSCEDLIFIIHTFLSHCYILIFTLPSFHTSNWVFHSTSAVNVAMVNCWQGLTFPLHCYSQLNIFTSFLLSILQVQLPINVCYMLPW